MAVTQAWDGAQLVEQDSSTVDSEYIITGTNDEFVAQAELDAATAVTVFGMIKKKVSIDERLDSHVWRGSVSWGAFEPKEAGDSQFSFDTTGGTAHVKTSLATVSSTKATGVPAAPDFENAIGVTDTGVEGTDITAPAYAFDETHIFDSASITAAYKLVLFGLTGTWNDALFKGFASGECMFMGAVGTLRDHTTWEISYKFVSVPNRTSLAVGPTIVVPSKRGHDLLWVRYREVEDATAGHLAQRPIAAYVEQVSYSGDLSLLGI